MGMNGKRNWRRGFGLTPGMLLGCTMLAGMGWTATASAEDLQSILPELLNTHNLVKAAEADLKAATERHYEAKGGWYPQVNLTGNAGREEQVKSEADNTHFTFTELDINLTQKVWDFGATESTVDIAKLTIGQVRQTLEATRQTLLLDGLTAYVNVDRAAERLVFAERAEANIKRQAELEDARVRRGAGYSSDVLQAKAQLALAQSRRVGAEGELKRARNAYRVVFGREPGNLEAVVRPDIDISQLPASVEEAVDVALNENPLLRAAQSAADIADMQRKNTKAQGYFPSIDFVTDVKFKDNVGGTEGHEREALAKVEVTYPFDLGFTARNTLRAAESDHTATVRRYRDARDRIEELVRNAWDDLEVAQRNTDILNNQAELAEAFLEQARRERDELGQRTLLEVTQAETDLLNASGDAVSAEADVAIAAYSLLNAMGRLTLATALD